MRPVTIRLHFHVLSGCSKCKVPGINYSSLSFVARTGAAYLPLSDMLKVVNKGAVAVVHSILEPILRPLHPL